MWPVHRNPQVSEIEASAHQPDRAKLQRHGVLLLRRVFTPEELAGVRERVEEVIARAWREQRHAAVEARHPSGRSVLGDLLSMTELRELDYVLLAPRLVECARYLLGGGEITYFGDSAVRFDVGGRGFHKDFVDQTTPTRGALRFALYLQDHEHHSGGLKVRLGSHRFTSRHFGKMMNVPTRPGDLAVFYLRSSHTGHNVRLRALPEVCLHPKLENFVPDSWQIPQQRRRMCMLWTYGKPGPHVSRYLEYITREPEVWKWSGYNPELVELAKRRRVELVKAIPEHGAYGLTRSPAP